MRVANKMLTIFIVIILVNIKIISGDENSEDKFINSTTEGQKIVTGDEDSENKFIDLLPEPQKQEFLAKIQERIKNELPEIKAPAPGNNTEADRYFQQLEDQGKSIKNILRSEVDSLQGRNIYRRSLNKEDASHIDLTLRSGKEKEEVGRPVTTMLIDSKNQTDIIPVVVKYDSESIKGSSVKVREANDTEVKKKNEITWITTSSTKSFDISNSPVNILTTSTRINLIDTTLPKHDIGVLRSTDGNSSASAVNGAATNKVNASTNHTNDGMSPVVVNTSKEAINLDTKPNNDSVTEKIVASTAKLNTSHVIYEKDNGTKGNILAATDDLNDYTTQIYVTKKQNHTDINDPYTYTTIHPYSETTDESSSLTLENVYASSDTVVDSTTKYDNDEYIPYEDSNETQNYTNTQNVDNSTTQYQIDISTMLDDVNATVHVLNNSSTLNNNDTVAKNMYSSVTPGDIGITLMSGDNRTLENNNVSLNDINDNNNTVKNAIIGIPEVTNDPIKSTANINITTIVDSSGGNITFKSNYMITDVGNVMSSSGSLATTEAVNPSSDKIQTTTMHNLLGTATAIVSSKAPHDDKGDTENNNIASVTTNNLVGSTIVDDVNADTDAYYHTTTANYVNGLANTLPGSTKLGDINVANDINDESVTVNIIKAITTDNLVGITKLAHVDPDSRDEYQSLTVNSLNTVTDSIVLGDVSTEKYGQENTVTDTFNVVTESLAGSTKLGNVNPESNIMGPMDHDASLKGSKTSFKIPAKSKVILNLVHNNINNKTNKKSKLDTDHKINSNDLLNNVSKGNVPNISKDLGHISEHFDLKMKEEENSYRVYEVVPEPHKNVIDATTRDPLVQFLKFLRSEKEVFPEPKHNEDDVTHPQYVRAYNYDPELAYFNADHHNGNNDVVKTGRQTPIIIKETGTRSKSTNLDVNLSLPFNTSKIKDIKNIITSSNNEDIVNDSDLNGNVNAVKAILSEDNAPFEKPLKRALNKIRQKLFNVQHRGDGKKINDYTSDKYSKQGEVGKEYESYQAASDLQSKHTQQLHTKKQVAEGLSRGVNDIVAQVQNLVDRTLNFETSASYKKKDSVGASRNVEEVLNSFKRSKNPDIQLVIETLENIEDNNRNRIHAKTRFNIKDNRDGIHLKKDLSSTKHDDRYDDKHIPLYVPEDIHVKAKESEESKPIVLHDKDIELQVNTLKDLVDKDDTGLELYDWLGTTVLILAGIEKLQHLVESKLHHKRLHPLDHQLVEFVADLHVTAEEVNEHFKEDIARQARFSFPNKSKKRRPHNSIHKMLSDLKMGKTRKRSGHDINDLEDFLKGLQRALNDLHTAIKQISVVTKYKRQHWFRDIKHLYLKSGTSKEYLELLLHITTARLIGLLDESAKMMIKEDEDFVRKNRARIERIGVEFMMVLRICKEWELLN